METEPTIKLTERADIILKLGQKGAPKRDVYVASVVLSLASPVFAAMFGDRFLEGQVLSTDSPREVPLPDDDPASMLLICKIAHLRTAELPAQLTADAFADFAVACDKYDCVEAVQAWSRVWMLTLLQSPVGADFEKALFATYVLDLPQEFAKATFMLVFNRIGLFNISNATHGHDFLPNIIFDKLIQERRQCELSVFEALHNVISPFGTCTGSKTSIGHVIVNLRAAGVWPLGKYSLSGLQTRISNVKDVPTPYCLNCTVCQRSPNIMSQLTTEIQRICGSVKSLCLDCIKREAFGDDCVCRVTHPGAKTAASTLKS